MAAATVAALAACSGNPGSDDATGGSGERTTITLWNRATSPAAEKLTELVERFNNSQDQYTVESQYIPADGFNVRVLQAINSNQAPNVVLSDGNPSQLGEAIETGEIVALDDLFGTGDYPLEATDIPEGMLATGIFDGTTYAVPTEGGNYAIIYNKQMFDEAGIDELPTTWAEVRAAAETLTTGGRYGIYLPIGSNEWPVYTWQSMLWSAGGEFLDEDNTEVRFDSPEGVEALTVWTDLVEDGYAYPSSAADSNQQTGFPAFNAGLFAMFIGQPRDVALTKEALGAENVGVFTFPEVSEPAANTGTNVSYIIDGTDEQEAGSYAFLSWFLQPEQQTEWDIAASYLPTNLGTAETEAFRAYLEANPDLQVFVDQLTYAKSRPSILNYAEVSAALGAELERAMLLQKSPADALQDAAALGQPALDD
ncbi:ABC transporter substrate-binding protein [Promicromonospora sp. Populi]|uniref:ABC transporter substrate-binding protein n=1 Tax=Promicromonospora sp. Populi TaxID=3239420 RepID=UPI0034E1A093